MSAAGLAAMAAAELGTNLECFDYVSTLNAFDMIKIAEF